MENKRIKEIKENLELIEDSSKFIQGFIEGLTAAAILQGLSDNQVYKVEKMYEMTNNIRCHCSAVRDLLKGDKE